MIPAIRAVSRISVYIKFCISVNGGEVMEGREKAHMADGTSEWGSAGLPVSLVQLRGKVSGLVEERQSSDARVQDVIGEVSSSKARAARHADLLPKSRRSRQEKDSRHLFLFPLYFFEDGGSIGERRQRRRWRRTATRREMFDCKTGPHFRPRSVVRRSSPLRRLPPNSWARLW